MILGMPFFRDSALDTQMARVLSRAARPQAWILRDVKCEVVRIWSIKVS